ncbi:MAG: cytochrome B [Bacteroidia bacterium]|nr:cytochrome B [Bacteroidia bacterium]
MRSGLLHAHSGLRYVALALLIAAIGAGFAAIMSKKAYTPGSRKLYSFAMVSTHIQLLIGIVLYIMNSVPMISAVGMGEVMKEEEKRFWVIEHPIMMLLSVILITAGFSMGKRARIDLAKHRITTVFYLLGLILIFFAIPWPFMSPGRPWF